MRAPNAVPEPRAEQPRQSLALWMDLLGPPLVWLTQFEVRLVLASAPPGSSRHAVSIGIALVALVAIATLGAMSWRHWRVADESPLDRMAGITRRIRFMGMVGLMMSGLFFLVTAAQVLADLFIPPGKT